MAVLIDGKAISSEIKEELKQEVAELKAQGITRAWLSYWWETTAHLPST